jgi:hypothetical protein
MATSRLNDTDQSRGVAIGDQGNQVTDRSEDKKEETFDVKKA